MLRPAMILAMLRVIATILDNIWTRLNLMQNFNLILTLFEDHPVILRYSYLKFNF